MFANRVSYTFDPERFDLKWILTISIPSKRSSLTAYAGLINYGKLNTERDTVLLGPSFAVDTACSSSLQAFQLALDSIRAGHCDAALVAGKRQIKIFCHVFEFIIY